MLSVQTKHFLLHLKCKYKANRQQLNGKIKMAQNIELSDCITNGNDIAIDSRLVNSSISTLLDEKIFIDDRISSISGYSDLSVVKLNASEYSNLLTSNSVLSNALYIVQDSYIDAYGQQMKNLAAPTDLSDATNKKYVDNIVSSSLIDFYKKSETSSAVEISDAFASIDVGNKIFIDNKISSISGYSDLSVVKLNAADYASLLISNSLLSNALYIVEDSCIDAYGRQLKNLAAPTDLSDATTKEYVDNAILSIQIPTDLSDFTNSPGYVTEDKLSNGLSSKADLTSLVEYLPLSGGSISGDIEIVDSDLLIKNGNFSQGYQTSAVGTYSHAEGYQTAAYGQASHAEGFQSYAYGIGAHAGGMNNYAIANGSTASNIVSESTHEGGDGKNYAGTFAFVVTNANVGLSTITLDSLECEQGNISGLIGKWITLYKRSSSSENDQLATYGTHLLGIVGDPSNKTISVDYVPSWLTSGSNRFVYFPEHPLYGTTTIGDGAFAHGFKCHAVEDATAIGCENYAFGRYAVAIGVGNKANYLGVAIGTGNGAYGMHTLALGGNGGAGSTYDINTRVYSNNAFAWSSGETPTYIISGNARNGTFNVDPLSGASGFYIGNTSLCSLISNASSSGESEAKAYVKASIANALSGAFTDPNTGDPIEFQSMSISSIAACLSNLYVWASSN